MPRLRQPRFFRAILIAALLGVLAVTAGCSRNAYSATAGASEGRTRTYFIAADEVEWNYAPIGRNLLTDEKFGAEENVFAESGQSRIGSTYLKALYREYQDSSFTEIRRRPAAEEYLGNLGPIIRAEVGDTIEVTFRNNTGFPTTMHPHGVFYAKASEGAPYSDGVESNDKPGDSVAPGQTFTYSWQVPERAGPGPSDPSSIMWMYHGHVDEPADTYAGLIGPMIVTRAGAAKPDGSPADVDAEFISNFMVSDENQSQLLAANIKRYLGKAKSIDPEEEAFVESNLMHSVNGYVYGNQPMMTMRQGQRVRWHIMAMGTEVDLHTPHWHGNTLTSMGMRTDTLSLLPGAMMTADMVPDNPGIWLFHCHVNDHIKAGMMTRYQVLPETDGSAQSPTPTAPGHLTPEH